jgi:hypothetical protein
MSKACQFCDRGLGTNGKYNHNNQDLFYIIFKKINKFIKLPLTKILFSNGCGDGCTLRDGIMSSTVMVNESEGVGYSQDIRGRFRIPTGYNLRIFQDEAETIESITNYEDEKIDIKYEPIPYEIDPPVSSEDGSIRVSSIRLKIGVPYQIYLNDKRYLVIKSEWGAIDIYESTD